MKKIYFIVCGKYRRFKNPKIYKFQKTLFLSIVFRKCGSKDEKIFKEEESIEKLNFLIQLITQNSTRKNMTGEHKNLELILKEINGKRNYFIKEIKQN